MEIVAIVWVLGLATWVLLPVISEKRTVAARTRCLNNLDQIGKALSSYMTANGERWPFVSKLSSIKVGTESDQWQTLPAVLESFLQMDSDAYRCPLDSRSSETGDADTYYESEGLSYEWFWSEARGGRKIGEESISNAKGFGFGRADQRVLSDFEAFHEGTGGGGYNILFADFVARESITRPR
ncbi:MAG TPA: hypothetical protein VNT79_15655 [Phycisphaerae bacterium]|nr:hypothetical protein [Phycisphaerae bacterium]